MTADIEDERTRTCFRRLWKLLSAPPTELWRHHRAGATGAQRQREALELLASVLWHLDSATSLAKLPTETMENYYEQLCAGTNALTPWKAWVDKLTRVTAESRSGELVITYSFNDAPDERRVYAIQNTLIADAAMRLDSAREVLRPICNSSSSVFMSRRQLEGRLPETPRLTKVIDATAIVVAFRDSYLPLRSRPQGNTTSQIFGPRSEVGIVYPTS
jgi:hypothetical protein